MLNESTVDAGSVLESDLFFEFPREDHANVIKRIGL
jgi:hypothetical protein